jgi:MFS family permease
MNETQCKYFLRFIGAVCIIFALGITTLIVFAAVVFLKASPERRMSPKESGVVFGILMVINWFFIMTGYRLFLGKPRKDGGLFSPIALYLAGVMFLMFPVIGIISKSWFALVESWHSVIAALGCFALARYRQQSLKKQNQESYQNNPIPIN